MDTQGALDLSQKLTKLVGRKRLESLADPFPKVFGETVAVVCHVFADRLCRGLGSTLT